MQITVNCTCGAVEMTVTGEPLIQYVCHCDDCQAVHGQAYACSLHPAIAVVVVRGETDVFILRAAPRTKCRRCGTFLFAEVPGYDVRDPLPHYKGIPARFNGCDDLMPW